ncbi:MAG: helix-turn-helix domain-containing protein, partial [Pseudomonadota bacterium]
AAISTGYVLVVAALIVYPDLLSDVSDVARAAYTQSTLTNVDVAAALSKLQTLMRADKLFTNERLSLAATAEALEVTPHQLSELVNSSLGMSFSRYLRQHRVEEARRLLVDDPSASVLAVSMMAGFRSQSNFYVAFREIVGQSPGDYRKSHARDAANTPD